MPHLSHLFSKHFSIDRAALSSVGVFTIALKISIGLTAFVTMGAMEAMRAAPKLAMRVTTVNKLLLKKRISNSLKKRLRRARARAKVRCQKLLRHFL